MSFWDTVKTWFGFASMQEIKADLTAVSQKTEQQNDSSSRINNNDNSNTMNSIMLDAKMETLYLIDTGRALSFDLSNPNGVIVAAVGGQLVAATGAFKPAALSDVTPGKEDGKIPPVSTIELDKSDQWTITFNGQTGVLAIIGVTDITAKMAVPEPGKCKSKLYNLRLHPVNIRREKERLVVSYGDARV